MTIQQQYFNTISSIQCSYVALSYLSLLLENTIKQLPADISDVVVSELQEEANTVASLVTQAERVRDHIFSLYTEGEEWTDNMAALTNKQDASLAEILSGISKAISMISEMHNKHTQHILYSDVERGLFKQNLLLPLDTLLSDDSPDGRHTCTLLSAPAQIKEAFASFW